MELPCEHVAEISCAAVVGVVRGRPPLALSLLSAAFTDAHTYRPARRRTWCRWRNRTYVGRTAYRGSKGERALLAAGDPRCAPFLYPIGRRYRWWSRSSRCRWCGCALTRSDNAEADLDSLLFPGGKTFPAGRRGLLFGCRSAALIESGTIFLLFFHILVHSYEICSLALHIFPSCYLQFFFKSIFIMIILLPTRRKIPNRRSIDQHTI